MKLGYQAGRQSASTTHALLHCFPRMVCKICTITLQSCHLQVLALFFFKILFIDLFIYLCIYLSQRKRTQAGVPQAEGEGKSGSQQSREPYEGLDPRTLGSWFEPKADVWLRHPGAPIGFKFLMQFYINFYDVAFLNSIFPRILTYSVLDTWWSLNKSLSFPPSRTIECLLWVGHYSVTHIVS